MKAFLSVVLLLAFGAGVWGVTPEQFSEWEEAAENGDADAQKSTAFMLHDRTHRTVMSSPGSPLDLGHLSSVQAPNFGEIVIDLGRTILTISTP
jgi:hypothetical protein